MSINRSVIERGLNIVGPTGWMTLGDYNEDITKDSLWREYKQVRDNSHAKLQHLYKSAYDCYPSTKMTRKGTDLKGLSKK